MCAKCRIVTNGFGKSTWKERRNNKNWENGLGAPDFPALLEWFNRCGVDAEKCLMAIYDPNKYERIYHPKKIVRHCPLCKNT